jgi:AraC family transcriptional regulator
MAELLATRAAPAGIQAHRTVLARRSACWRGVELRVTTEDICASTTWSNHEDRHAVIVHLDGPMHELETELEGGGTSRGRRTPGEMWLIPAGRRYVSRARGGIITYAALYIAPDTLAALIGERAKVEAIAARLAHRDEFLYRSVQRLAGLIGQTDDLSEMLGETLSQALCLHLLREYRAGSGSGSADRPGPVLSPAAARLVQEYVHAHLAERITLDALSALAGLSTHDLLIAYRRAFGTTPAQYVIAQRLRRARWLLANTAEDITAIALATGFGSHSHLAATFKKHTGLTPREFRARWRE